MQDRQHISIKRLVILCISGLLIGGGAILPGVSGGVLCVIFGIYQPMMEMLSAPRKAIPKYWRMFVPVMIGLAVGFLSFAKVIEIIFAKDDVLATWLFVGLIAGTIPSLWKDAGNHGGHSKSGWVAVLTSFVVLFGILLGVRLSRFSQVTPNIGWYIFSGILWGLSLIVPGMTSSSILMSLGLFEPLAAGISSFDPAVLLPWIGGLALTAVLLARVIHKLFINHDAIAHHGVVGVVAASTLIIIPTGYSGVKEFILSLLCGAVGIACALLMDRIGLNASKTKESKENPAQAS